MGYRLEKVTGYYKSQVESRLYFSQMFYWSLIRTLLFKSHFQKTVISIELCLLPELSGD